MINPVFVGAFHPDNDYLWITWSLLTACNYTCRYCHVKGTDISTEETDKKVINFIRNAPQASKEVTLFGGEPSIHPRILDIAKELTSFAKVHIFTNLSMDYIKIERLTALNVNFSISYHPDIINPDHFIDKIKILLHYDGIIDFVNVMMVTGMEDEQEKVCSFLRDNHIRHRLLPIWEEEDGSRAWVRSVKYSRRNDVIPIRDTHVVDDKGNDYIMSEQECIYLGKTRFEGWHCAAGMRSLFIAHDGTIARCQADMKNNIAFCHADDYYPPLQYYTCPHKTCTCEYYIPKMRDADYVVQI